MVINTIMTKISFGLLCCVTLLFTTTAYGAEPTLLLKLKILAIEKTEDLPIGDLALSIADIKNDSKYAIVVSGNGYLRIFEWNGTTFESKWKSPQYSHQVLAFVIPEISRLMPTSYYSGNKLQTDYLIFIPPVAKASEIYRLELKDNKYGLQKIATAPFNWFRLSGKCQDDSSLIIGDKFHQNGNYAVVYKWDGSKLVERWQGIPGAKVKASGEMFNRTTQKIMSVFLLQNNNKLGILSCGQDSIDWKEVDKDASKIDLWQNNRIGIGRSLMGVTKKSSTSELWSIQYPSDESECTAKLYVSQFDGKRFSPFSRVTFNGINSDMIFNIIITDVDSDGVGEILGVEQNIRKSIPRNNPADTGEEGNTLFITSNLFLAKWNGKEYEVKWHRKAIDERVRNIAVGDVTGDGKKEIVITDDNGFLYVFDMPSDK